MSVSPNASDARSNEGAAGQSAKKKEDEPDLTMCTKLKLFLAAHWRGVVLVLTPIIWLPVILPFPATGWQWCAYTLLIMAIYWVSECIPLALTGFLPCVIFPLTGVASTSAVTGAMMNDSVLMFVGSIILAFSVEQSGLHKRLAYAAIRCIGYSHVKLLLAMCIVTTFVSMWITNTAAVTLMVPIVLAVLRVFESENLLKMYETDSEGNKFASDVTAAYFCAITYSATCGGIGTLVGTGTNLVFKSLFVTNYPDVRDFLSFPLFSAFGVPNMIVLETCVYLCVATMYFGLFRPKSKVAMSTKISEKGKQLAQATINDAWIAMGFLTYWELMVICLFGGAIVSFFCRSPQIFEGWGDVIVDFHGINDKRFIKDSALAMLVAFLMFLLPSQLSIFKNCTAKHHEDMPKKSITSVLDWSRMNAEMPYSFMFLLGGGVALSRGANWSGLNDKLGDTLAKLSSLPNLFILLLVIIVVIFVTNFASNVAVINVFGPIAMELAKRTRGSPLLYIVASGFSASYCFMLPVGTPGNLIVQQIASIPTKKMVRAGFMPSIAAVIVTWIFCAFYAPVVWPDLNDMIEQ